MLAKREVPSNAINYEMCKTCYSPCCGHTPCEYLPTDFIEPKIESIEQVIVNNFAIIDQGYLVQNPDELFYYLRARTFREDLNEIVINNESDIYLAKQGRRGACLHYKSSEKYYHGIEYAKYDKEKILSLSKSVLLKLFKRKWEYEKIVKPIDKCIEEYLEARNERAWGGCLLSEEQRPGGGLFAIPDLRSGVSYCKLPEEYTENYWESPENQEVLKRILSKNGII